MRLSQKVRERRRSIHGRRKWRIKTGFKPESTIVARGKNKGVLLAALIVWELKQDGVKRQTQWDLMKGKKRAHGHRT